MAHERDMSQSTPQSTMLPTVARGGGFIFIVASGLLTAFVSQASSPDYRALLWSLAPFAAVHFVSVAIYFLRVHRWHRWLALAIGTLAGFGFVEMALRVL